MNISGPAAVAKPEMLFYAPGDLTVTDNAPIYKELLEGRTKATNRKKLVAFVLHISR